MQGLTNALLIHWQKDPDENNGSVQFSITVHVVKHFERNLANVFNVCKRHGKNSHLVQVISTK